MAATLVPGSGNLLQMAVCCYIPRQGAQWRKAWEAFTNGRVVPFWFRRGVGSMWGRVAIFDVRPFPTSPTSRRLVRRLTGHGRMLHSSNLKEGKNLTRDFIIQT